MKIIKLIFIISIKNKTIRVLTVFRTLLYRNISVYKILTVKWDITYYYHIMVMEQF